MHKPIGSDSDLIQFYRGELPDQSGRRVAEILGQNQEWLELTHDYIQWVFPLTEASAFNPEAPVLTPAAIAEFRADPALGDQLQQAFRVMLAFYGLRLESTGTAGFKVTRGATFEQRAVNWITPGNHNHLRITRILKSLVLLGQRPQAEAFLLCLQEIGREHPRAISKTTLNFWRNAVS